MGSVLPHLIILSTKTHNVRAIEDLPTAYITIPINKTETFQSTERL